MVLQSEQHDQRYGRSRLPPFDKQKWVALHLRRRSLQVGRNCFCGNKTVGSQVSQSQTQNFWLLSSLPGSCDRSGWLSTYALVISLLSPTILRKVWHVMVIFCFFCHLRSIHLAYVEDVEVKGIQAYRFAPPSDVLMSPKENPTNEGFCVPAGDCLGTGVLKVSVCREGKSLPSPTPDPVPVPVPSPLQIIPDSKQTCWALYLAFPLFEHIGFYSIHWSMINRLWRSLSGEWLLWYNYQYSDSGE